MQTSGDDRMEDQMSIQNGLPSSLDSLKKQAKERLRSIRSGDAASISWLAEHHPDAVREPKLAHVQFALARQHGFGSWPKLKAEMERRERALLADSELRRRLVDLAFGWGWNRPRRAQARAVYEERPGIADGAVEIAALVSDAARIDAYLGQGGDPNARFGDDGRPLLSFAAASIALGTAREADALALAGRLIDAGAGPNGSHGNALFPDADLRPLYYAVGIANSPAMAQLLLSRGADPNDGESLYHSMDHSGAPCLEALIAAGARWEGMNSLARALDMEEPDRIRRALALGADPNRGELRPALHHAVLRGRSAEIVTMLLEAGADPNGVDEQGHSVAELAARWGRRDVLALLADRGVTLNLQGRAAFLAACAAADRDAALASGVAVADLTAQELGLLAEMTGLGNEAAVQLMLELGWPVDAAHSWATPLNEAAFHGDDALAALLLDHGAHWSEKNNYGGDAWGSVFWASANLEDGGRVGNYVGVARLFLERGSPVPAQPGGSEEVQEFLAEWQEEHPEHPVVPLG